jgi:4-hydroxy-4-methyl-2-oxoglutarate aldolase
VVVQRDEVVAVTRAAELRVRKEDETRSRLANGELGLDIYGLRKKLSDLGLKSSS